MPDQSLDLGPEPSTLHGFARDIWRISHQMQQDIRELHGRMDSIAGVTNGAEPGPASLAGVYSTQKQLRRDMDDHLKGHDRHSGRWWTVGLASASALIAAFGKEIVKRI